MNPSMSPSMPRQWLSQIGLVMRLEMRKTFFSRRGIWVYLLALAPVLIFLGHSLSEISTRNERRALNAAHPISTEVLRSITQGMTTEEVIDIRTGEFGLTRAPRATSRAHTRRRSRPRRRC